MGAAGSRGPSSAEGAAKAAGAAKGLALTVFLMLPLAMFTPSAHAWGWMGHAVIAYIAEARLSPVVHRRVMQLLETDRSGLVDTHDIGDEASWADRYRDAYTRIDEEGVPHRVTRQWHFVDLDRKRPDLSRACFGRRLPDPSKAASVPVSVPASVSASIPASSGPEHMCIVDKLVQFRAVLANPSTSSHERLRALQFMLHLVGDIHQPMHAISNDDAGGNDTRVSLRGARIESLHHLWDTTLVERLAPVLADSHRTLDRASNAHAIADALLADVDRAEIEGAEMADAEIGSGEARSGEARGGEARGDEARGGEARGTDVGGAEHNFTRFDPEAWAWESYDVARTVAYGALRKQAHGKSDAARDGTVFYRLGKKDEMRAEVAVAKQLTRAGLRLASVLEAAFAEF